MEDKILIDYIKGTLNLVQVREVISWLEANKENSIYFANLKAEWILKNLPNENLSDKETDERLKRLIERRGYKYQKIIRNIERVAAVLFIPLVFVALYLITERADFIQDTITRTTTKDTDTNNSGIVYFVDKGVKGKVTLPDGSSVWLNSNSSLKWLDYSNLKERMVELSGEAFFDVTSDSLKPMIVKTSKGITIKVFGTSFNVSSYINDKEFKFTLISGSAYLIKEISNQIITVKPSDEVVISDKSVINKQKRESQIRTTIAWKEGHLIFEKTPMDEVMKKLERWYGVTFEITNKSILNYRFTASFNSEPISQVLELLAITSNISYTVDGNLIKLSSK
ncbi:MAG: FecR family protein [Bacteroidales bacterium]|jgi:ferric-dicitrate binding protein FerR (iron transport regulator)